MIEQKRRRVAKERILEEACRVFGEKGYRDATHAEICRSANTNIASINYYFKSKEELYHATFMHLGAKVERAYPLDGGLDENAATPEERLRAFISAFVHRALDSELGSLHRILMSERFAPTGLLDDLFGRWLARDRAVILKILNELIGPGAAPRDAEWCEMSIIGQMIGLHDPADRGPRKLFGIDETNVERLIDHIYKFSMGGIAAIRRWNEAVRGGVVANDVQGNANV